MDSLCGIGPHRGHCRNVYCDIEMTSQGTVRSATVVSVEVTSVQSADGAKVLGLLQASPHGPHICISAPRIEATDDVPGIEMLYT